MAVALMTILGLSLSTWIIAILPASIALYWVVWIVYTRTLHPLASVPGPFWASVSRTWYMYRIYAGDSHSVQRRLHEQFGPIIRIAPDEVVTTDPEALRKIYRNQGPLSKTDFYTVWGAQDISEQVDNFVQTDERLHSNYRRIVNPVYTLSNVLKSEMYINKVSELFLQRLDEHASRNEVMDLGHWLQM